MNKDPLEYALACNGLALVARGMDLTKDKSWKALVACADCIAEKFPNTTGPLDVLLEIDREVKR